MRVYYQYLLFIIYLAAIFATAYAGATIV